MNHTLTGVALVSSLIGCTGSVTGDAPGQPNPGPVAGEPPASVAGCDAAQLLEPRLLRLAATELRNHVRRCLPQVDEALISTIDLQAEHLAKLAERSVSGAEFGAYHEAARAVGRAYVASADEAAPCSQVGGEEACLQQVLKTAVSRLYRTPPSAEEWAGFEALYRKLFVSHGSQQAAQAVVAGALLSPRTLFQTERGDAGPHHGSYPLANSEALTLARFALTGRAPDDAERASLSSLDPAAFRSSLGQLAASWVHTAEFSERAVGFVRARFGLEHLGEVSRLDLAFTPEVQQAMELEFREHVSTTLLSANGSFDQLFSSDRTSVLPGLEAIYGTGDPAVAGSARRKGVLGLAGLLSARASPVGSDPVKRGIMVRVELLCEQMPPPIPDANFGKVAVTEEMQTRERFEALAAMPACQSCHQVINPPGYLFEEFDQLGRYRSQEKGRPINAVGTISPFFGAEPYAGVGSWDGIVPLANWLAQSKEARVCFATHFASYLLAQGVPQGTANCWLPSVTARFLASGRLDELTQDFVQSDLFLQRSRSAP